MNKYSVMPEFKFSDEDMVDIISSAVYDIGYWACIDNTTEDWQRVSSSLPSDSTFEDVIWALLKTGNSLRMEQQLSSTSGSLQNSPDQSPCPIWSYLRRKDWRWKRWLRLCTILEEECPIRGMDGGGTSRGLPQTWRHP